MNKLLKVSLIVAGFVAASVAIAATPIVWLIIADPFGGAAHPTDVAMLAQFARVRPALEELVVMIWQDGQLERLAPDFTRPDPPPIRSERLADYRARLLAAGIAHGFSHYGNPIEFLVSAQGLAISGSGKSFVRADDAHPDAIVVNGDLDAAAAALTDKDVLLQRRIANGWWLQLDRR